MLYPGREFILDEAARTALDAACLEHSALDDVLRGLEWRVLRDPGAGYQLPGIEPPTYIIRSKVWVTTPSLVLVYQFNEDCVTVIRARVLPLDPDEADEESVVKIAS